MRKTVINTIFLNFSIGLNTYLQKTSEKADLGSAMAVGCTISQIPAVVIPLFGGIRWILNRRLLFLVGTVFSLLSLWFTQKIRTVYHGKRGKVKSR